MLATLRTTGWTRGKLKLCLIGVGLAVAAGGCGSDDSGEDEASATEGQVRSGDCSTSSLSGSYGVRFDGTNKALGRFASVSLWRFDGKSRLEASEDFNSARSGPKSRKIEGRYRMRSDCRFELSFGSELVKSHEADGKCVLVAGGREFFCLDAEENWVTTGIGRKL